MRNDFPLNNNRNQNNRRRGRGNRNQGGGGGSQANRIDSRARGNAPQLLDKYKKLAEDAHRNGDRVQAEYYLQFADHYFRVIADNRARQDEQRGGEARNWRRDEREGDDFDTNDEDDGFDAREQRDAREPREQREPRRERGRRDRENERDAGRDTNRGNGEGRRDSRRDEAPNGAAVVEASEGSPYDTQDNPFTREARENARDDREERPKRRAPRAPRASVSREEDENHVIDAAVLPPSLSANDAGDGDPTSEDSPRPRRRKRGDGGTLSAVG